LAHNLDSVRLLHGVFLLFLLAYEGSSGFSFNGFQENTPFLFLQKSGRDLTRRPIIQLKVSMPNNEKIPQVCSQDHFLVRVIGSMKLP
jgi:hypothetical protein